MRVVRIGHEQVRFEYHYAGQYIRRTIDLETLSEFLLGGPLQESNLGPKARAITFAAFGDDHYLPKDAKRRMSPRSFVRETATVKALKLRFGEMPLHRISRSDWDTYQSDRLSGALGKRGPCKPGGVLKEFKIMRKLLSYAVETKYIRDNVLGMVKPGDIGLFDDNRADIWFNKEEIGKLFPLFPPHLRDLFEFRLWTGARPEEAAQFGKDNVDWNTGKIWILTLKKKRRDGGAIRKRYFRIKSLGPQFEALLRRLAPDHRTGLFFANPEDGQPYVERYLCHVFAKCVQNSGIKKRLPPRPYDLRGTFAMHRAMVVRSFRQLQLEMGHVDGKSIEHYLAEAEHLDPRESIFFGVDVSGVEGGI